MASGDDGQPTADDGRLLRRLFAGLSSSDARRLWSVVFRSSRASPSRSDEDVIGQSLFLLRDAEALRLEIEHRAVAAALRHQIVVRAELDDATVLEHADAVGVAYGGEAVRYE